MRRTAQNELRLGKYVRQSLPKFNVKFKKLFSGVVWDPARFLKPGFAMSNLCVIANIVLHMVIKSGQTMNDVSQRQLEADMNLIPWADVITPDANGIPVRKLTELEQKLNPIPNELKRRFKILHFMEGVSLNLFELRTAGEHARLFSVSLGKNYQKIRNFLQIDLLLDNPIFREENCQPTVPNHCFLISNITLFLHRNQQILHRFNWSRTNLLCRGCCMTSENMNTMTKHFEICKPMSRLSIGHRATKNILIHKPKRLNKFTNKYEDSGTSFSRGDNKMLIQNLTVAVLDYECAQMNIDQKDQFGTSLRSTDNLSVKTPKNALTTLPVISVSWAFASNYPQSHPLPDSLKTARFIRVDETSPSGMKDFFIGFFLKMRADLVSHFEWLQSILSRDVGPPPIRQRPLELVNYFETIKECQVCGKTFNTKSYSAR